MAVQQQSITLEEFLQLPEEEPALEFENGMVTQKVPPQGKHARIQLSLGGLINRLVEPGKIAMAFSELRTTFAGRSRVPDVSVYRWDRIPTDADGEIANDFREPPDIAIEIVSPGQSVNQQVARCLTFVNLGVQAALIVDPGPKTVLVFRPGQVPRVFDQSEEIALDDIIAGLRLSVNEIFSTLTL
jgi:Uma2 family endonuclease